MANVAALKKKAADFELKKQLDKAVATYQEILAAYDAGEDDSPDVGLYNRVGDLLVRQGNTPDAVALYERAVDLYAEGGFFNNAIALCNKILRTSPGRAVVYYKLGKISAAKGFKGDAKQNFLEYADRMQKSGDTAEAFRALKEFADLCPDQDDIRLMLAEQLSKADRKGEAVEQLQQLYTRYISSGREAEAEATATRLRAIDPNAEIGGGSTRRTAKRDDLVFLDLDAPSTPSREATPIPSFALAGMEPTVPVDAVAAGESTTPAPSMLGLEPTALDDPAPPAAPAPETPAEPAEAIPMVDMAQTTEQPIAERAPEADVFDEPIPLLDVTIPEPTPDIPLLELDPPTATVSLDFVDLGESLLESEPTLPSLDFLDPRRTVQVTDALADLPALDLGDEADSPLRPSLLTPAEHNRLDLIEPDEPVFPPPPRRSSVVLADSAALLLASLEGSPDDHALRREYAEALLDRGDREAGMKELETALMGFERGGDLASARSVVDEILRLEPGSVRYHQKRVELAFRANDKPNLVEAYLALADALTRDGQPEKARVVYERVLEIAPEDPRARAALDAFGPAAEPERPTAPAARQSRPTPAPRHSPAARGTPRGRRYSVEDELPATTPAPEPAAGPSPPAKGSDDDYVSLGDWLREDEGPKSTRMVVGEEEPSGDEQADFADMLRKFKQGVADNVDEADSESHYDLGVAFKEMGLLDEAIAEFQKALRGTTQRVRTFEALGQCFVDKGQLPVALTILQRAINEPGAADEQLVGVLYLIASVSETMGKLAEAKGYFERVFAVDIQFRDVGDRLNALDQAHS